MKGQRRGQVIAMSTGERDSFLGEQRTCRVATVGPGGPHVTLPGEARPDPNRRR